MSLTDCAEGRHCRPSGGSKDPPDRCTICGVVLCQSCGPRHLRCTLEKDHKGGHINKWYPNVSRAWTDPEANG